MSKCVCFKCNKVNKMPILKEDELCLDGFSASCPSCGSINIDFTISAEDMNQVPFNIKTKMLSAMYD